MLNQTHLDHKPILSPSFDQTLLGYHLRIFIARIASTEIEKLETHRHDFSVESLLTLEHSHLGDATIHLGFHIKFGQARIRVEEKHAVFMLGL
jgi:hypothetical protein